MLFRSGSRCSCSSSRARRLIEYIDTKMELDHWAFGPHHVWSDPTTGNAIRMWQPFNGLQVYDPEAWTDSIEDPSVFESPPAKCKKGGALIRINCDDNGNYHPKKSEGLEHLDALYAMAKAEQAEGPFLMGSEAVPSKEALKAVSACEKEAVVVKKELSEVRAWFEAKCAEAATFPATDRATRDNIDALSVLSDRVEALRGKLSQFEGDAETRKRTATESAFGAPAAKAARA